MSYNLTLNINLIENIYIFTFNFIRHIYVQNADPQLIRNINQLIPRVHSLHSESNEFIEEKENHLYQLTKNRLKHNSPPVLRIPTK